MFRKKVDSEINLVLLQEIHADALFALVDSDREFLNAWLPWPPATKTVDDTRAFIKSALHGFADGKTMVCGIEYQNNIAGVISFNAIRRDLKKVELGYWLSSSFNGRGIMTRCCKAMIACAFDELGMEKAEISAATGNIPSRRVCERLGLTHEGTITHSENLHGQIVDHAVYGIHKAG